MQRLAIMSLLCFILLVFAYEANSQSKYVGEKIDYFLFPFGKAEYNDLGQTDLGGIAVNLVTFRTQAMGFDDTEKIYYDPASFLPLKVERDITIWGKKECLLEDYRPAENSLVISKFKNDRKVKEYRYKEQGPIHNAILLPFYLRTIADLDIGYSLDIRLPDKFKVTLVSIEEIEIPSGKFKAFHFTSSPSKFEIWISRDELRLPLKVKGLGPFGYTLVIKERVLNQ